MLKRLKLSKILGILLGLCLSLPALAQQSQPMTDLGVPRSMRGVGTVSASGVCTAGTGIYFGVISAGTVEITATGTFSAGTVRVQASGDGGTTFSSDLAIWPRAGGASVTTIGAAGIWNVPVVADTLICAYGSGFTGSVLIVATTSPTTSVVTVTGTVTSTPSGTQTVQGGGAAGSPPGSENPVMMGGYDTANVQRLAVDSSGRPRIVGAGAAGAAATGNPVRIGVFDGTNTQNAVVQSAASAATSVTGNLALVATEPATWTIVHEPAVATQATIAKGAGAAGVRHILKSYKATLTCNGTAGTPLFFRIRDGACGAGTIVWTDSAGCPVNGAAQLVSPPGLTIVGTAATAMCAEFSGAGAAATQETVSAAGYDAN